MKNMKLNKMFNHFKVFLLMSLFLNTLTFKAFSLDAVYESKEQKNLKPKRIGSVLFDQSKPKNLYLSPGLGSMILFPCFLSDAFLGSDQEVSVRFSPSNKKTLLLSLKSSFSKATNLIVSCENQKSKFVFDLIPSLKIHQDLVEIRSSFGRPELEIDKDFLINKESSLESSKPKRSLIPEKEEKILVNSSSNFKEAPELSELIPKKEVQKITKEDLKVEIKDPPPLAETSLLNKKKNPDEGEKKLHIEVKKPEQGQKSQLRIIKSEAKLIEKGLLK